MTVVVSFPEKVKLLVEKLSDGATKSFPNTAVLLNEFTVFPSRSVIPELTAFPL